MTKSQPKALIPPQMSGWCGSPATDNPEESHARCRGGNTARPSREFQPCPCSCHYRDLPHYKCECGGRLVETTWENPDPEDVDEDGNPEPVYVHVVKKGKDKDRLLNSMQECP